MHSSAGGFCCQPGAIAYCEPDSTRIRSCVQLQLLQGFSEKVRQARHCRWHSTLMSSLVPERWHQARLLARSAPMHIVVTGLMSCQFLPATDDSSAAVWASVPSCVSRINAYACCTQFNPEANMDWHVDKAQYRQQWLKLHGKQADPRNRMCPSQPCCKLLPELQQRERPVRRK